MKLRLPQIGTRWAIFAGAAYVLCFPRWDMPWLGPLFSFGLAFAVRELKTYRQALGMGLLISSMIAWGGFHWIIYVAQNFGGFPLPLAVLLLCLFCLVAAPHMLAYFCLHLRFRKEIEHLGPWMRPLLATTIFVGLEYLAHFLKIFPEHLGNPLIAYLPLAQSASLGGVALLSFLPFFLGSAVAEVRYHRRAGLALSALCVLISAGFWVWGNGVIEERKSREGVSLRVGLVQHNMDELEKLTYFGGPAMGLTEILERLKSSTRALASQKPDLILWPETAYPLLFPTEGSNRAGIITQGYANLVKDLTAEVQVPLLFGGYENVNSFDHNSAIFLNERGQWTESYRKNVLLVFGEYMPLADWIPALKKINPQLGDFGRGAGPIPMKLRLASLQQGPLAELRAGVNICYEAILPSYMRDLALAGSQVFINLTKDSWFGDTFEPWQHFQLTAIRSIEHGIPMVRSTNTGLSGSITSWGETKLISLPFREANEIVEVRIEASPTPTLYTKWGDWFAWLCLLLASIGLVFCWRSETKYSR
jgi:apolipoprotein N-acyltransferase